MAWTNRNVRRVVAETAHDADGYYFSVGVGERIGLADFVGPFVTEEDRDRELAYEISRIRRAVEDAGGRLRPLSGGTRRRARLHDQSQ